ncbi:hypothetical protein RHMOL_Rhmol07G0142000 [Rhododendron molle]|uniref:Uncharacterized protein n=1 Tax=Rhododendron molle TaxID=49168 RepID=A0ACC0N0N1_RHOML|nr:hypothetical protein RHMOL_Rhmol07G0142000 [Rhododendron molle]
MSWPLPVKMLNKTFSNRTQTLRCGAPPWRDRAWRPRRGCAGPYGHTEQEDLAVRWFRTSSTWRFWRQDSTAAPADEIKAE